MEKKMLTIFTDPPLGQDMTQGHFFKCTLPDLDLEISFS